MARLPRLCVPGQLHLLIQRAQHGQTVFAEAVDCEAYLDALRDAAVTNRVSIHAFALMPGEVRLLATPADAQAIGRMIQSLGRRFTAAYNARHARSGALWQGRFSATVVEAQAYLMACLRFVEAGPVAAGLVARAADYPWSSAGHHSGRNLATLISEHPGFWSLGNTPFEREVNHGRLMEQVLTSEELATIETSAHRGWALGSERFMDDLAGQTPRRLRPLPQGRPTQRLDMDKDET